ncbi:MAG: hypothetical protein WDM77_12575 [Steroidobacteraceae bacterium]
MQRQPARASYGRFVSRLTSGTLAIVMAGGRGERLKGLTVNRCKPATAVRRQVPDHRFRTVQLRELPASARSRSSRSTSSSR